MGTIKGRMKSEYFGCFWHGCLCMPSLPKPTGSTDETLQTRYEETNARLKKSNTLDTLFFRSRGCEFRKLMRDTAGLENELCSHPYVKNSPIKIHDTLYGGRTQATKTYYRVKEVDKILYESVPIHL